MTPIRIPYNRKGKVLSDRFSKKKEVDCREPDVGKKEDGYSIESKRSVLGFEILNFLSKQERCPSRTVLGQARSS